MSVSGLGLNQNLFAGIDSVNAAKVSGEIFSRAAEKTIDLSKTFTIQKQALNCKDKLQSHNQE